MWKGMKHPAKAGDTGLFAEASNEELIDGNIMQILGTRKGERVMLPRFGTRIWEYIHEPLDGPTKLFLKTEITEALEEWEDRIKLRGISFSTGEDAGLLKIRIAYSFIETGEDREIDLTLSGNGGVTVG